MEKLKHPTFENIYADTLGNIYSGENIVGCYATNGYKQIQYKGSTYLSHRVIAECILGRLLTKDEVVNHKNLLTDDNKIENSEIGTQAGNIAHYWRHFGEIKIQDAVVINEGKAGEKHHNARLTQQQVEEMILSFSNGLTNKEASSLYGVHERYVSLIRHKKRWKKAWVALGLERSETIPSGSRAGSDSLLETETSLQLRDMI
jgi:hypothetical protein